MEFRQAGIRYLSHPCKFVTEDQLEILMMVIYNHNLQTFGNFARHQGGHGGRVFFHGGYGFDSSGCGFEHGG